MVLFKYHTIDVMTFMPHNFFSSCIVYCSVIINPEGQIGKLLKGNKWYSFMQYPPVVINSFANLKILIVVDHSFFVALIITIDRNKK